jgi:uncharacterized delta-60 repeat protein
MRGTRVTVAAAALCLLAASPAAAAPGSPDPSFGKGGLVVASHGDRDVGYGVVRTADGRTVVAGAVSERDSTSMFLTRYLPNGRLDTSFGSRGVTRTGLGGSAMAVELDQLPDGRLLAVGLLSTRSSRGVFLARFLANGRLDTSYGKGGVVVRPVGRGVSLPFDSSLGDDGSVAVVGVAYEGLAEQPFVMKVRPDGTPDTTFAPNGTLLTSSTGESSPSATLLLPDGSVAVAGTVRAGDAMVPYFIRYLPTGTQDPAFGSAAMTGLAGTYLAALARSPEGLIYAAGSSSTDNGVVLRFLPTGLQDLVFGTAGVALVTYGGGVNLWAVGVVGDGRVVVAGVGVATTLDLLTARLTPLGALDAAYGKAGVAVATTSGRYEEAYDLATGADGGVTVAGVSLAVSRGRVTFDTVTARFLP